jgi:hypothetical protein
LVVAVRLVHLMPEELTGQIVFFQLLLQQAVAVAVAAVLVTELVHLVVVAVAALSMQVLVVLVQQIKVLRAAIQKIQRV